MTKTLPIWDQRMLDFKEHVIQNKIMNIDSEGKFMEIAGIPSNATYSQVRKRAQSFRHSSFKAVCDYFGLTMDYFYGYTDRMNRLDVKMNPVELLNEATRLINAEFNTKPRLTKKLTKGSKK